MKTLYSLILLSLTLSFCSNPKQNNSLMEKTGGSKTESNKDLSEVLNAYMNLKNALVETDAEKAKTQAKTLSSQLMNSSLKSLTDKSAAIASTDDINQQRAVFHELTENLIPKLKQANLSNSVYVQYCPMAFDNEGARWLSTSEEIRNPYFGDMMLKCGKVVEEI